MPAIDPAPLALREPPPAAETSGSPRLPPGWWLLPAMGLGAAFWAGLAVALF
ncbi:hypothetical protein [Pseudoroseicyclus tamaricis]|uniref:Uncharacterized protein n=1 Tax=Pseudoroseicyclus tamaricis TaxID=2705421 RepID=A0A6B2JYL0_9RHOB|nr:hypothetical protein [Pseudoroseicyclus tamaricis]NDV01699.1 hypothetical protein [Pseudoroseicyclus tamaricis]